MFDAPRGDVMQAVDAVLKPFDITIGDWVMELIDERIKVSEAAIVEMREKSDLDNRRELQATEGRVAIPYLYDPNTEQGMFESTDIIAYLESNYGAQASVAP